ncbi:MAG: cadherin-like beta sandwich domain-containing protein [Eubacteriales bacterium]|nr:cadherin-like beta sandwich domain-containing protein [Eubacteriales bacterium]
MKFIKTGIITLILCAMSAITAFSAQGTISFSDPSVNVGDEVNVSMKIAADEGTALSNANIVLTYPSGGLEFVSGTDAEGGAGAVRVHGTTNGGGTANLEYNLKFKTSTAGSFDIAIDSYEVYDAADQPIEFTHLGNSTVSVKAEQNASADCTLSSLDVYPGTLEPAFSSDNMTYNVTVGLGVEKLTINAITTDGSANVRISDNDALPEGDSVVLVTVNAADGTSSIDYVINVSKVEGGPESTIEGGTNVDLSDGVQLSSKGKTITIMNPSADVAIPDGFKQGTISIDDQKVQGWVWGASDDPDYCVVYGMNDKGEINFYRYDMVEKTIQRYFEDPLSADSVSNAEYSDLEAQLDAANRTAESRLIIMVVIAVIAFAAVMASVYMYIRLQSSERLQKTYRKQNLSRYRSDESAEIDNVREGRDFVTPIADNKEELKEASELLKHDFTNDGQGDEAPEEVDETQVIRRPDRKRRARRSRSADTLGSENADGISLGEFDDASGGTDAFDDALGGAEVSADFTNGADALADDAAFDPEDKE